jgi:hypothetical protein
MLYRVVQSCYVFLLVCCLFVPVIRISAMSNRVPHALADFPTVDPGASLTYTWDFGDGTQASGITVDHTYAIKGNYTLTLTVRSATGMRQVQKIIPVLTQPVAYNNPYKGDEGDGNPPSNPQVILPLSEVQRDGPLAVLQRSLSTLIIYGECCAREHSREAQIWQGLSM